MISKHIIDSITRAAVLQALQPRIDMRTELEHELAGLVNADYFTPEETEAVQKLPQSWWQLDECVRVVDFRGYSYRLKRKKGEGVVAPANSDCVTRRISSAILNARVQDFLAEGETYNEDYARLRIETTAFLRSFSSLKKLSEAWPEGAPFYGQFLNKNKQAGTALAIPVAQINAALGLGASK